MAIELLIWNFVVCIFLLSRCSGEAEEAFWTTVSKHKAKYIPYQKLRIKQHNEDCIVRLLCAPDPCQICLHLFSTFTDAVHINAGNRYLGSTASNSSYLSSVSFVIVTTCLKLLTFTSLSFAGGEILLSFLEIFFSVSSTSLTWLGILIPLLLLQNWIHKCCGASHRRWLGILFEFVCPKLPNITKKKDKNRISSPQKWTGRIWMPAVVIRALVSSRQRMFTSIMEVAQFP